MKNLYIIGAGGYAKSVLDSLDCYSYKSISFIDQYKTGTHIGYPIISNKIPAELVISDSLFFVAIGDNDDRRKWFIEIKRKKGELINVIDTSAIISKNAKIGEGCFIGKYAIVNSDVIVKDNCVINTRALVEHGCRIHAHANISTNAVLNGDVSVEESSFIGSSSVTNGQISIGKNVMVGSGSVVTRSIPDNSVAVGIPAKVIKKR